MGVIIRLIPTLWRIKSWRHFPFLAVKTDRSKKIEASGSLMPADTTWIKIDGGCHAQFGDYGLQPGDGQAKISPQQQWDPVTSGIAALLLKISRWCST